MHKKNFLSPSLRDVDNEVDPTISAHKQNLDRVSNDIKSLENRLLEAAIPFTFIYVLKSKERTFDDVKPYFEVDHNCWIVRKSTEYIDDCLSWYKTKNNVFRLCYCEFATVDEFDQISLDGEQWEQVGETDKGSPIIILSKPLIEMKIHFRQNIENELPHFYKSIVEGLKKEKDTIISYSPNYKLFVGMVERLII